MENNLENREFTDLPKKYLSTISATLLTLIKLAEGAGAVFLLYMAWKGLYPMLSTIAAGSAGISSILGELPNLFGTDSAAAPFASYMMQSFALPGIFWIITVVIGLIGIVFRILEAVALTALRFARKGAGLIKTIHKIYYIVYIIEMGFFAFTFTTFFLSLGRMSSSVGTDITALRIGTAIVGVIYLVIMLMIVFYHVDIVKAMDTVDYEIRSGQPEQPEETHLSGLSVLFSIPFILAIVMVVLLYFFGPQYPGQSSDAAQSLLIPAVVPAVFVLKYLSVAFCNRNLKRASRTQGEG